MELLFNQILPKIRTILNVASINIIIVFYTIFKKKKVIFFYHSRSQLTEIHKFYMEKLFTILNKKHLILYGHTVFNIKNKNYFFLKEGALKFIFNVKIFISNNVCDNFTHKSKKIYIHHDIYDSPLINPVKKKELVKRLLNYNYLFLPNEKTVIIFKKYIDSCKLETEGKNLKKIFDVGYFKLDLLKKRIKQKMINKNSLVIAMSDIRHIKSMSLIIEASNLIKLLLTKTNLKIIFRPYPANRTLDKILQIKNRFKNCNQFIFDESDDYFNAYVSSKCLITDISGTAYTYAFFTKRPVIFYTKYEKILNKYQFNNLNYFKDRNKIGFLSSSNKNTLRLVLNIDKVYNTKKKSINKLEKDFTYINKSQIRITNLIKNML